MIITALIAVSLGSSSPSHAMHTRPKSVPMQVASLFGIGKQKDFTEIVQKVQSEQDYAPQVGRQPERNPEPLVPVRYLTAEQRAEPIIVEPAPIYVSADDQSNDRVQSAPRDQSTTMEVPVDYSAPSYITSTPQATGQEAIPSGSATGSTATADYGTPG